MNTPRLDRLSALLEGLSPTVSVSNPTQGFAVHIAQRKLAGVGSESLASADLDTMCLLACPAASGASSVLGQDEQLIMSFAVAFNGPLGPSFMAEFSSPIRIGMKDADPSLLQVVTLIANEMQAQRCGQPLFINRAGEILLIGLMRHLTSRPQQPKGIFTALSDPRIAKSLVAMHTTPGHPWTLENLADLAGMSRTSFANHFRNLLQISPGKYLANVRLAMASQLLQTGIGLKKIATQTGYASPSTLSRALGRRLMN
jgi:AraC-like DNA-binding protein